MKVDWNWSSSRSGWDLEWEWMVVGVGADGGGSGWELEREWMVVGV